MGSSWSEAEVGEDARKLPAGIVVAQGVRPAGRAAPGDSAGIPAGFPVPDGRGGGRIAADLRWAMQTGNADPSGGIARPESFRAPTQGVDSSGLGADVGSPPSPTDPAKGPPLAQYLRRILAREESLLAAFQPVLLASRCKQTGGIDRAAFALAVTRIRKHFDPSEPNVGPPISVAGPPLTREEAFAEFSSSLQALCQRLEASAVREASFRTPMAGGVAERPIENVDLDQLYQMVKDPPPTSRQPTQHAIDSAGLSSQRRLGGSMPRRVEAVVPGSSARRSLPHSHSPTRRRPAAEVPEGRRTPVLQRDLQRSHSNARNVRYSNGTPQTGEPSAREQGDGRGGWIWQPAARQGQAPSAAQLPETLRQFQRQGPNSGSTTVPLFMKSGGAVGSSAAPPTASEVDPTLLKPTVGTPTTPMVIGAASPATTPLTAGKYREVHTASPRLARSATAQAAQATQVPAHSSREDLGSQLEASRSRVAGFRRSLAREEDLLRQQVVEIQQLEGLQRQLEAKALSLASEPGHPKSADAEPSGSPCGGGTITPTTAALGTGSTDFDEFAEPMSLEDVKRHLDSANLMRRRLQELEEALDQKEDEVAALTHELRLKWEEEQKYRPAS